MLLIETVEKAWNDVYPLIPNYLYYVCRNDSQQERMKNDMTWG